MHSCLNTNNTDIRRAIVVPRVVSAEACITARSNQDNVLEHKRAKIPSSIQLGGKRCIIHDFICNWERVCGRSFTAILFNHTDPLGGICITRIVEEQHIAFFSTKSTTPR